MLTRRISVTYAIGFAQPRTKTVYAANEEDAVQYVLSCVRLESAYYHNLRIIEIH